VLFESGFGGGAFVLTSCEGGYEHQEKNYMDNLFEQGFVDFDCKSLSEIWTLDSSGEIKQISKESLLGKSD
jgi:hypothetical protein